MPNLLELIANDPQLSAGSSKIKEIAGGAARGLTTDVAGAPVDLVASLLTALGVPVGDSPVGGSKWLRTMLNQPKDEKGAAAVGNLLATILSPDISGKLLGLAGAVRVANSKELDLLRKYYDSALINKLAEAPDYKSRSRLVLLAPDEFLSMASQTDNFPYASKLRGVNEILDSGELLHSPGFLQLNSYGQVVGHEGRHRALAMQQRNVPAIPVELRSDNIRWSEQAPDRFDRVESWPTTMLQQDARFSIPFPIPQEDAATAALRVLMEIPRSQKP